jgi:hypothetical protein
MASVARRIKFPVFSRCLLPMTFAVGNDLQLDTLVMTVLHSPLKKLHEQTPQDDSEGIVVFLLLLFQQRIIAV